jgi:hypothetical protein
MGLVSSALQFEETGNPFALRSVAPAMRHEGLDIAELTILRDAWLRQAPQDERGTKTV